MAKKYVSRYRVWRNGVRVENLKNFKKKSRKLRAEVDTSDGGGTVEIQKKLGGFTIDYAIPKINPKLDWSDCVDETWTIERDGGKRETFSGVDILEQGEEMLDGEKETVITLDFASYPGVIE